MPASRKAAPELPVLACTNAAEWQAWLEQHHNTSSGVWLRLCKKGSEHLAISYAEAVETALCFGWIDGQKKALDHAFFLHRFTPRGRKSIWSQINRDKALALIASGRMRPAGLREVESAQADGRWDAAYPSQSRATVPADLQAALDRAPKARAFFQQLTGANRYAVLFRIQTATKPETRQARIAKFVAMLERGETLH